MQKQTGFALLSVLIFLQLFAILGLYVFEMSVLQNRINNDDWRTHQLLNTAQQVLENAETQLIELQCFIPVTRSDFFLTRSLSWWKEVNACAESKDGFEFFYVVESLGDDPCAQIDDQKSAAYFRITLLGSTHNHSIETILQSTVIKPANAAISSCQDAAHRVTMGRQMWRKIQ